MKSRLSSESAVSVRFGERLRYRLDVDPAALEALVPRLSVQTLVANRWCD